jgi:hypothetical protein
VIREQVRVQIVKQETTINLAAVKDALSLGMPVSGAELLRNRFTLRIGWATARLPLMLSRTLGNELTDAVAAVVETPDCWNIGIETRPCLSAATKESETFHCATMREIGALFNINESRVSQIHKRALERMAAGLRSIGIVSSNSILLR